MCRSLTLVFAVFALVATSVGAVAGEKENAAWETRLQDLVTRVEREVKALDDQVPDPEASTTLSARLTALNVRVTKIESDLGITGKRFWLYDGKDAQQQLSSWSQMAASLQGRAAKAAKVGKTQMNEALTEKAKQAKAETGDTGNGEAAADEVTETQDEIAESPDEDSPADDTTKDKSAKDEPAKKQAAQGGSPHPRVARRIRLRRGASNRPSSDNDRGITILVSKKREGPRVVLGQIKDRVTVSLVNVPLADNLFAEFTLFLDPSDQGGCPAPNTAAPTGSASGGTNTADVVVAGTPNPNISLRIISKGNSTYPARDKVAFKTGEGEDERKVETEYVSAKSVSTLFGTRVQRQEMRAWISGPALNELMNPEDEEVPYLDGNVSGMATSVKGTAFQLLKKLMEVFALESADTDPSEALGQSSRVIVPGATCAVDVTGQ